jgi:hypothetical protein
VHVDLSLNRRAMEEALYDALEKHDAKRKAG